MSAENITSPQFPTETEQVLNQLVESCPISDLLGTKLTELNGDELDAIIDQARTLHESPASLKKFLRKGESKPKKQKAKVQLDLI